MGQKDLKEKNLEAFPDVAADLINVLIYNGEEIVSEDFLRPVPTETIYGTGSESLKNQYTDDLKLNVYEMANLDVDVRKKFRSDIRVVVDYLAEGRNYKPGRKKLKHPKEVLFLLRELTHDISFDEIRSGLKDKEEVTMRELLDRYEKRGEKRGLERGSAKEIISFGEELNWSVEEILSRLTARLQIKDEKAREYYRLYSTKA